MIIIIDSIDRVGKTTLANKLATELNAKIYKHSIKNGDYKEMKDASETCAMFALINLAHIYKEQITIFDRFHLSNTIYGLLTRKYDLMESSNNFNKIDEALANLGDEVYLIKVNPTDINLSSAEHGSDLQPFYTMFNMLYEKSKIKNKFETDYLVLDELVEKFKIIIEDYYNKN